MTVCYFHYMNSKRIVTACFVYLIGLLENAANPQKMWFTWLRESKNQFNLPKQWNKPVGIGRYFIRHVNSAYLWLNFYKNL